MVQPFKNCSQVRFNASLLFPVFREGPFNFCAGKGALGN